MYVTAAVADTSALLRAAQPPTRLPRPYNPMVRPQGTRGDAVRGRLLLRKPRVPARLPDESGALLARGRRAAALGGASCRTSWPTLLTPAPPRAAARSPRCGSTPRSSTPTSTRTAASVPAISGAHAFARARADAGPALCPLCRPLQVCISILHPPVRSRSVGHALCSQSHAPSLCPFRRVTTSGATRTARNAGRRRRASRRSSFPSSPCSPPPTRTRRPTWMVRARPLGCVVGREGHRAQGTRHRVGRCMPSGS